MGLLDRFRKNSLEDDEDDDELDDEEEDDEEDDEDEDDDEAEQGGGLFGMIRGLGGKLLGQGDDDEDDEDDEDEDDEDESPVVAPSAPVQAAPKPPADTEAVERKVIPSLEGFSLAEPDSPALDSADVTENLPVNQEALTSLTEEDSGEDPSEDSSGAPDRHDLTSEETPVKEVDFSKVGRGPGDIFEKKVEVDQKLRNLAMSQEDTQAEVLATELHELLRELEELIPN